MTRDSTKLEVDFLYELFEEEINQYNGLIRDLKEESKYLKEGLTEPLMRVIQSIEEHIHCIEEIEKKISDKIAKTFPAMRGAGLMGKKELSILIPFLPREDQVRIEQYQKQLAQVRERVKGINERNKWFAEEYLALLSDMITLIVNPPPDTVCYGQKGLKRVGSSSLTLNREV